MIYLLILALNFTSHGAEPAKTAPISAPLEEKQTTEVVKGEVFELESKAKLFNYESERISKANTLDYTARYKDLNGDVVAEEKAEIINGEIKKYEAQRMTTKEKGLIEVRDGRIFFTYSEMGNKKTKYEKLEPNTLVSASICPFLETRWSNLMAKQEINFRYAVWYRQETVGFKIFFDKEEGNNVIFQMVPTNIFYRSLVNPLFFYYNKKDRQLVTLKGRTMPKYKKGNAWRDLDAIINYSY
jgi:hypothetical protein